MSTALELLDAIHTHLAEFDVPDPASVHVSLYAPEMTVQLGCREVPQVAAVLLAWADTLTEPTAHAWRVPKGDRVHLSVIGRLPGGVGVRVYGGVPFTECGPGGGLALGATAPLLLGVLRHLADTGEVPA